MARPRGMMRARLHYNNYQKLDGVFTVSGPMCRWLVKLTGHDGKPGLVRKRTRWVTNSRALAEVLDLYCTNELGKEPRRHITLMGSLATLAAQYPPKLITAVLKGIK